MATLSGFIFDLDGIVADTEPHQIDCYLKGFRAAGFELSREEYVRKVVLEGDSTRELCAELGGDEELFEAEILPVKDECYFHRVETEMEPREGLLDLLDDLQDHGVRTPLCTSSRNKNAEKLLTELELEDRFEFVLSLDDVMRSKPDPEVFMVALQKLDLPSDRVLAVDDAPKGVLAAGAAGIRPVACPTDTTAGSDFSRAWRQVDELTELSYDWLISEMEADSGPAFGSL